eukprot:TRINITY_DN1203_c0_g1_i2.p1 TRINITY_DN1203_c0_g1~~TRINITY_DN1203_c0_g1_i2.p1  ORF type:complete len:434 (-),score=70.85 TRINITY_DN1203_c0_g1_i2:129-1430(-)
MMEEVVKTPLLMRVDKLTTELSMVRDELDDAFPQDQNISYEILSNTIPQKKYVVKVAEFVPSALLKDTGTSKSEKKKEKKSRPTTALPTTRSSMSLRASMQSGQERAKTPSTAPTSRTSNLEKSRYLFQKLDDEVTLEEKIEKNTSRYKYGRWYIPTEQWGSGEQRDSSQSTDTQTKLDFDISKLYSTQIYKDYLMSQGTNNLGILSLLESSPNTEHADYTNTNDINSLRSSTKLKSLNASTTLSKNPSKKISPSSSKGHSLSRPTTVSHGTLRRENLQIRTPLPKSNSMSSFSNSNTSPPLSPQPAFPHSISPRRPSSSLQRSKSHHFPNASSSSRQPLVPTTSLPSFQMRNQNPNGRSLSPTRFLTVDNSSGNNSNSSNNNNSTPNSTGQPSEVIGSFTKVDLIFEDQLQVLFEQPRSPSRSPKNTYRKSR